MLTFLQVTVVAKPTCPEGKTEIKKEHTKGPNKRYSKANKHNKNPLWRDVKLASEL